LKKYHPVELKGSDEIKAWNRKEIKILLGHPASMGHGLNMQQGGNNMLWFGRPWQLELFQQAPARLNRQGQLEKVIMNSLIAKNTMDEDVVASNYSKANTQELLMQAVKARVKKHLPNLIKH
jgi:SNF2 family DNA or RNA helicase